MYAVAHTDRIGRLTTFALEPVEERTQSGTTYRLATSAILLAAIGVLRLSAE
jgi:hypothetical protein